MEYYNHEEVFLGAKIVCHGQTIAEIEVSQLAVTKGEFVVVDGTEYRVERVSINLDTNTEMFFVSKA